MHGLAAGQPAARPLVAVTQVAKRYGNGTVAVQGVDLAIGRGDFLSLLGPSGCGKSTLLRMISGLIAPSSGTIEWPTAMHDASGSAMPRLGFVFQEPTLMPWATAVKNVALPLKLEGIARADRLARATEALGRVGLSGFENAYPRSLSGGMRMRVSIARALVTKPDILLMDEPFAALDEITRFKLNNDLLDIWAATGITVVFVTHSVFESVYLSKRVVVMAARPGRVVQDIAIAAGYPRGEAFRTSPDYAAWCRTVSLALGEAMAA